MKTTSSAIAREIQAMNTVTVDRTKQRQLAAVIIMATSIVGLIIAASLLFGVASL